MPKNGEDSIVGSILTVSSAESVDCMTDGQLLEQFLGRGTRGPRRRLPPWSGSMARWSGMSAGASCPTRTRRRMRSRPPSCSWHAGRVRSAGAMPSARGSTGWPGGLPFGPRPSGDPATAARRAGHRDEGDTDPTPDPIRREQIEALHEEVDRLAEKYSAPLVLCYFEGRTHAEAARLLGCPVGTVSFRLSQARDLLRARLTRRGLALPAAWAGATLRSETASAAIPTGLAEATIKAAMNLAAGKVMAAGMVPVAITQLVTRRNPYHGPHETDDDRGGCGGDRARRDGHRPARGGREADPSADGAVTPAEAESGPSAPPAQGAPQRPGARLRPAPRSDRLHRPERR